MTTTDTPSAHQEFTFDDLLRAMRETEITIPENWPEFEWPPKKDDAFDYAIQELKRKGVPSYILVPLLFSRLPYKVAPMDGLKHIAKELRRRGIRFPQALAKAVFHIAGAEWAMNLTGQLRRWKELLIPLLEANREIFEPVYRTGRFLPPFSSSFGDVSSALELLFFRMMRAAGIRNPGDYVFISDGKKGYGYTDTLVLFIPISSREYHLVALTVRRRRWYIPPSKALENLREMHRRVLKLPMRARKYRNAVANETYVMVGRYTNGVRGTLKRKGYSKSKRAVLVFDDRKRPWFLLLVRFLRNLFSKRLSRQEESLGDRKPYGIVAQRMRLLRAYLSVLNRAEENEHEYVGL